MMYFNCNEFICFVWDFMHSVSGNTEIGNGYGVPGGGAYYDAPTLKTTAGKFNSKTILLMLQHSFKLQ